MQKKCTECGELKQLSEFHKDKSKSDGYMNICKTCKRKKNHQQYINSLSPEELIKYNRSKSRKKLLKEGKSVCSECKKIKPLDNFRKSETNINGHRAICKTCESKKRHQKFINSLDSEELKIYKQKEERKNLNNKLLKKGQYNCSKCGKTKPLSEFHKDSSKIHGYSYACKACDYEYYLKHRIVTDTLRIQIKRNELLKENKYLCACCGKIKKLDKFSKNSNNVHGYTYTCKDCRSKKKTKLYYENIEHYRKQGRKRYNNKKDDPQFKVNQSMSSGIYYSLKGNKNGRHWESFVDYNINELKTHLEKQFNDKMTWNNYGSYWEIDHLIAKSLFNFTKPEHIGFKRCWALDNLRPLKISENRSKSNKLIRDKQEYLTL